MLADTTRRAVSSLSAHVLRALLFLNKSPDGLLIALALFIAWISALSLALQRAQLLLLLPAMLMSAIALLGQWWLRRFAPDRDRLIFPLALLLTSVGLIALSRTAPNFLPRQMLWVLFAGIAFCVVVALRQRELYWLRRFKYIWLAVALMLLAATLMFGVNPSSSGPRLWLNLGGTLFVQPSELVRLCLVAFLAAHFAPGFQLTRQSPAIADRTALGVAALVVALSGVLLLAQQDLGAASLLALSALGMLLLAGGHVRWIVIALLALVGAMSLAALLSPRVMQRIAIWVNPWLDPRGASFQISQSLIALAEGGLFGRGIGQGSPDYVPAVHTDFPFVMIVEEMGALGGVVVLIALGALLVRMWRVSLRAASAYASLLAGGIALSMGLQMLVILGGNMAVLPITGVTLPFISYGGTSLLVNWLGVALVVALSAERAEPAVVVLQPERLCRAARMLASAMLGGVAVLTTALLAWSLLAAPSLRAREDNPRRIAAERAIFRGAIYDRHSELLAYSACYNNAPPMTPCATTPPSHVYTRSYPAPEAAHVVGYYSLRYGLAGAEAFADNTLRGSRTWWQEWMHQLQAGAPITLTLDLSLQRRLLGELRSMSRCSAHDAPRGAVVALDWRSGELHALGSLPYFNPAALDADWETLRDDPDAPLLNRATQGLYQPGALLPWLMALRGVAPTHEGFAALGWHQPMSLFSEVARSELPARVTISETQGQGSFRAVPLRVAVSVAEAVAEAPVTPNLLAVPVRTTLSPNSRVIARLPFEARAMAGSDREVMWRVRLQGDLVVVLASEVSCPAAP